ncbi:MAG: acyl-CoA dehydrogenase family protein [Rhodovibrionaceae bacterium]|nr:acyl-CoA dehydrogenase family protein [Rhodovibrionaceae bacterium]
MIETPVPSSDLETHEVRNQPGEPDDFDALAANPPLEEALRAFSAGWAREAIADVGRQVGSRHLRGLAGDANRNAPELHTHDRFGRRIDVVEFHPAYHELMRRVFASGVHCLPWAEPQQGAQVARAALSYLWNQCENGVCCPVAMTFASIAALEHDEDQKSRWAPLLTSRDYDPRPTGAGNKRGITMGMAMTEKQGGSDLRQTQTTAHPAGNAKGPGAEYLLTGHKWFFSVPMSDLFLTLAQSESGLSCFLAPGWLDDGRRNGLQIQRLKDKCGNRANASSEVEFRDLRATMLGEEGKGLATVLQAAHLTRLECAIGSAGVMRNALVHSLHHVQNRSAFGARLIDQPLMRNVVADLALESEAATWMTMRLAHALDRAADDEEEKLLARVGVPVAKYWICKRAPAFVAEAMEAQGGNGYVEEGVMGRLFRESPLNGIWEGASNVICLDVLRALGKTPESGKAFLAEAKTAKGGHPAFDRALALLEEVLGNLSDDPQGARRAVALMALVWQASLLLRHAPEAVAAAFCESRLNDRWGVFGTLPASAQLDDILERASTL